GPLLEAFQGQDRTIATGRRVAAADFPTAEQGLEQVTHGNLLALRAVADDRLAPWTFCLGPGRLHRGHLARGRPSDRKMEKRSEALENGTFRRSMVKGVTGARLDRSSVFPVIQAGEPDARGGNRHGTGQARDALVPQPILAGRRRPGADGRRLP